jgi:hypothetical protein
MLGDCEATCEWLKRLAHFALCSIRAWLERSIARGVPPPSLGGAPAEGSAEAAEAAEAQAVPWVSLLPSLPHLLALQVRGARCLLPAACCLLPNSASPRDTRLHRALSPASRPPTSHHPPPTSPPPPHTIQEAFKHFKTKPTQQLTLAPLGYVSARIQVSGAAAASSRPPALPSLPRPAGCCALTAPAPPLPPLPLPRRPRCCTRASRSTWTPRPSWRC